MFTFIKPTMDQTVLVTSSVVIALFLLEYAIRFFYPQPINYYNFTLIQADSGDDMVISSNASLSRQVRRERPRGYGPYVPQLSTDFGGVRVAINSHGWRDSEHHFEKPQGVTRILIAGDSVTFGYGVQLEDTFPRVLEQELNRQGGMQYEVISLGGAGGDTYFERKVIKDNVSIYAPDLVILAFNLNDILPNTIDEEEGYWDDINDSFTRIVLRSRKKLDATFRSRSHLYFLFRERMKDVLRKFAIVSPTMLPIGAFDIESDYGISAWRDTSEVLLEIAGQLQEDKVKFLIAILPVDMQVSQQVADIYRREYGFIFADNLVNGKPQEVIKDFANRHGIACVDLLPAFQKEPEEKKFFRIYGGSVDWNHPNPLGHRIIAEELTQFLSSHHLYAASPTVDRTDGEIRR